MRAKELVKEYEGLNVEVLPDKHIAITGDVSAEGAEALHNELGYYN